MRKAAAPARDVHVQLRALLSAWEGAARQVAAAAPARSGAMVGA
jgi:hypothetical protein